MPRTQRCLFRSMSAWKTIIMLLCTVAVPSHSADAGRQAWPALPEGLFSNFGRLVQGATLDFGAHAAHFLLNGLPPERLTTSKPAGEEHAACGKDSAKIYCLSVAVEEFREDRLQSQSLGSTCAPTGVWQARDSLHTDFCQRRYPASKGMYISSEPCTLAQSVACG